MKLKWQYIRLHYNLTLTFHENFSHCNSTISGESPTNQTPTGPAACEESSPSKAFKVPPDRRVGCRSCPGVGLPASTGWACRRQWSEPTGPASCRTGSCPMGRTLTSLQGGREAEQARFRQKSWAQNEIGAIKVHQHDTEYLQKKSSLICQFLTVLFPFLDVIDYVFES